MFRKISIIAASLILVILFAKRGGFSNQHSSQPLDSARKAELIRIGQGVHSVPLCSDQFVIISSVI